MKTPPTAYPCTICRKTTGGPLVIIFNGHMGAPACAACREIFTDEKSLKQRLEKKVRTYLISNDCFVLGEIAAEAAKQNLEKAIAAYGLKHPEKPKKAKKPRRKRLFL